MANQHQRSMEDTQRDITDATKTHDIPDGYPLPAEAHPIWERLMLQRAYKDWYEADLLTAAKVCRYELIIRNGYRRLDDLIDEGADPLNPESVANEYLLSIEKAMRLQLTMLRSLGVTRASMKGDERRKDAEKANNARSAIEAFEGDGTSEDAMLAIN